MKKIGILTSGGDAPGMNAAIYGAVLAASQAGIECLAYKDGYEGLIDQDSIPLSIDQVKLHVGHGGTFIGTSRSQRFKDPVIQAQVAQNLSNELLGLIVIGGDGSFKGVQALQALGVNVIGIPATIDNDIEGTELTIGYHTAVRNVVEAVDIIMQSAYSHQHIFAIEVMGRGEGYIAKMAGQALMADGIIAEGQNFEPQQVVQAINESRQLGNRSQLFIIAEGAMTAKEFKNRVEAISDFQIHDLLLGHLQRGGNPVAQDRILGRDLGQVAVQRLLESNTQGSTFLKVIQHKIV